MLASPFFSPSQSTHNTPQGLTTPTHSYHSPVLTPSPLQRRHIFPSRTVSKDSPDSDHVFLHSPFKSPLGLPTLRLMSSRKVPRDDDESSALTAATSYFLFPPSTSQPLQTPVKQSQRVANQPVLTTKRIGVGLASPGINASLSRSLGTKRKSTPVPEPTPSRQHAIGSPSIHSSTKHAPTLDRLVIMPPPRVSVHTTPCKAETEVHLRKQTDTMTRLKICDINNSDGEEVHSLFSAGIDDWQLGLGPGRKDNEEVIEDISPDGHVNKRRARSRPFSAELMTAAPSPPKLIDSETTYSSNKPRSPGASLLSRQRHHRNSSSSSTSSSNGSPIARRRSTASKIPKQANLAVPAPRPAMHQQRLLNRGPLSRLDSGTLFFGPTIPKPPRPAPVNHSSSDRWAPRTKACSPHSSPAPSSQPLDGSLDEEDMFFGLGPAGGTAASFSLSVVSGTPSPRSRQTKTLAKKFKPRDSEVGLGDEDGPDFLNVTIPTSSTSVSTVCSSDGDRDALVTPDLEPSASCGWPQVDWALGDAEKSFGSTGSVSNVDKFILKTLAAGSKGKQEGEGTVGWKKPPGTPVKNRRARDWKGVKPGERPWQSAVAKRVDGFGYEDGSKVPRKSLPAAFPPRAVTTTKKSKDKENAPVARQTFATGHETDEGHDVSPSLRKTKEGRYGLGLGRPKITGSDAANTKTPSSARRTSGSLPQAKQSVPMFRFSGRRQAWHLPTPRAPTNMSPPGEVPALRICSGSSASSTEVVDSPTNLVARDCPLPVFSLEQESPKPDRGRFERDFVEVEEVGRGEFGKVIKVKAKDGGQDGEVFAIKKSKQFEGVRHRSRLMEEVEVLEHLTSTAPKGRHPNVLAYIDSWEQNDALYIRTELCGLGNFARFLWEYGATFPRLDEARVWKIIVDLTSGLAFIHDSGVIHLDLKPSNIFMTEDGRFKIGDFGMATLWPRPDETTFEREGDKMYLAPEVLQGVYSQAADIFSLGMTMLETASNIVVPDQGEPWHRLRQEDFSQVDLEDRPELLALIKSMMKTDPGSRATAHDIHTHPIVSRTRRAMERRYAEAIAEGAPVFAASPLSGVPESFLEEILGRRGAQDNDMDLGA